MNLNKKELLFISARFPYPLHKGDQLVLFNNIRLMSKYYYITLLSMYDEDSELDHLNKIKPFCKEIITLRRSKFETYFNMLISPFTLEPLQVAYYRSRNFQNRVNELLKCKKFDIVHVYMLRMAHYVKNINTFKILSLVDSMALNMNRRVKNESGVKKLLFKYESHLIRNYEKNMVKKFNGSVVVSNIDKNYINEENIYIIPIGVDIKKCIVRKVSNKIIFSGNMNYFPNQNAVIWFIENCLENIKKQVPDVRLVIVGKNPSEKIKNFQEGKNIIVKGYVDSMIDEQCSSVLAIAPMQSGSGMQIKVLEAMAIGLPIVVTSLGKGDILAVDNENILIADEAIEFSNKCIELLKSEELKENIGASAKHFIKNNHSWGEIKKLYISIYEGKF